jgi:arginyl-tRNA synthetase
MSQKDYSKTSKKKDVYQTNSGLQPSFSGINPSNPLLQYKNVANRSKKGINRVVWNKETDKPLFYNSIDWEKENKIARILKHVLAQAVNEISNNQMQITPNEIKVEHPKEEHYGDYSTNVAMVYCSRLKMKPAALAEALAKRVNEYIIKHLNISLPCNGERVQHDKVMVSDVLEKISFVMPGFINMTVRSDYLITLLQRVINREKGVTSTLLKDKKIAVEYTDPNPFKEFHIGHFYSNVIGESVSRIFEECGATVWRGDFYGDVGMHVAKSVWGLIEEMRNRKLEIRDVEKWTLNERQKFLGRGYALGVNKYEEDEKIQEEIKNINLIIYVAGQEILQKAKNWRPLIDYKQYIKGNIDRLPVIKKVYEAGLRWSLEYFESIYKRLGTKFDGYYPESWVGEYGMKIVEKGLTMGVLEKSEGGVIYRGEQDGLHTRIFVNKLGLPTYEAKDLGLAQAKYQDFQYDLSVNVFGKEIDEYYKVVRAAMKKIEPKLGSMADYLAHGMVKLPTGKMSSRTGNVVTFEWLLSEAKKYSLNIMKNVVLDDKEKEVVAEKVGMGAARYALLKSNIGSDVVFDFDKSISFEGDSGPYLMYTYARCRSVMRKANYELRIKNYELRIRNSFDLYSEEKSLIRALCRFPEVVSEAAKNLSPNIICGYLFDLAQKYNLFYNKHSILNIAERGKGKGEREIGVQQQITVFRLFLTDATSVILKKGLFILGIETVERM